MTLAELLPRLNATLNGLAGLLLLAGWLAIRSGARGLHQRLMLAAFSCSALFLVSYLTRVALTGVHPYPGQGALRTFYLALLGSHTLLAALALPLVLRTLFLAVNARFAEHRRIARVTFPVWLYVSVTGVAVYAMLYEVAPRLAAP
ncbi:MAG: DUF420 domain-containing protein [Anaeromyxobacter sp.]